MKNFHYFTGILIVLLCLFSCSRSIDMESGSVVNSFRVSQKDILSYVHEVKGVSEDTKSAESIDIIPIIHNSDTVMYIVNYETGWEVLSADRRAPVVLMTCDAGYLTESELYLNAPQMEYVDNVKDAIWNLRQSDEPDDLVPEDNWNIIMPLENGDTWTDWYITGSTTITNTLTDIDHLRSTHWGQSGKWNHKAPYTNSQCISHCPTGCVMVGGSQVLYYLHNKIGTPANTYGNSNCTAFIPDGESKVILNNSNTTFDSAGNSYWGLMPMSQSESVSQSRFDYVSTLMSRIGYLIGAEYGVDGTGAVTYNLLSVFRSEFSIKGEWCNTLDLNILNSQLLKKIPCIFSIGKTNGGGHCVVADGYRRIGTFRRIFYQKHNNLGQRQYKEERVLESEQNYIAINWGWNGTADYDMSTGATIWYNAASMNWQGYDTFKYMLYGFEKI